MGGFSWWHGPSASAAERSERSDSSSSSNSQPHLREVLEDWTNGGATPATRVSEGLLGARTDPELRTILTENRGKTVVVEFGSSWCTHCQEMFPHFLRLSLQYPENKYVLAQVDYMDTEAKDVVYTPTFAFYKRGKKVDDFFGIDVQRLEDHLWLHSDGAAARPRIPAA